RSLGRELVCRSLPTPGLIGCDRSPDRNGGSRRRRGARCSLSRRRSSHHIQRRSSPSAFHKVRVCPPGPRRSLARHANELEWRCIPRRLLHQQSALSSPRTSDARQIRLRTAQPDRTWLYLLTPVRNSEFRAARARHACVRCHHSRSIPIEYSSLGGRLLDQPFAEVARGFVVVESWRQLSAVEIFVIEPRIAHRENSSASEFANRHDRIAFVIEHLFRRLAKRES